IPVLNARVQALRTGAIDIALDVGVEDRALIEAAGGTFHVRPTGRVQTLTLVSIKDSPVADVRVRQALNYAVDKQSMVAVLLGGTTTPATQPAARQSFGYAEGLEAYPYDPARARRLLAEAGYPDGFDMSATFPAGAMAGDEAFYQQVGVYLADIGVRLTLEGTTFAQHISRIRTGGWPGDGFGMDYNNMPALDALWPMRVHSCLWSAPWHCRPEWVPLIQAAETATTVERRLELTRQLGRLYHDEPTAIFLWEMPGLDGVGPKVRNFQSRLNAIDYELIDLAD
ncbi:MAG: ABC transporter substrate-binding protein, partial [Planctomycetales bacterium]|nr:ABC transporter substrate-binding protein [Planctomycetales bacterium]